MLSVNTKNKALLFTNKSIVYKIIINTSFSVYCKCTKECIQNFKIRFRIGNAGMLLRTHSNE